MAVKFGRSRGEEETLFARVGGGGGGRENIKNKHIAPPPPPANF